MCRNICNSWGTSLTIPYGAPTHGLLIINQVSLYIIWVAGGDGDLKVDLTHCFGTNFGGLSATCNKTSGEVKVSITGINRGLIYIGR